jgi:hypothetical protein
MFKKSLFLAAVAAGLLIPAFSRASTNTDSPTITVNANVESYFEWDAGNNYVIDKDTGWTGGTGTNASHIGKPGDVITAVHSLTVNTNTDPSFQMAALSNGGILTEAGTSTTLVTSYKITTGTVGTIAANGSSAFLDAAGVGVASPFDASNTYTLTHDVTGQSNLNLNVKAAIPPGITLPKAANYVCTIKITATWS